MDEVDTERGGIASHIENWSTGPVADDDMAIEYLRETLDPDLIEFRDIPEWAVVRQALVEAGTRYEALTLALLVGLRACTVVLHCQKQAPSEYILALNTFLETQDPRDELRRRLKTGFLFRELRALLVLGYCLECSRSDLNKPILSSLNSALPLVCQMNAGPIDPEALSQEFDPWYPQHPSVFARMV